MRLKSVWINQYKNLNNFSLDFDSDSFIDIFVGKNGSGKSNLFEALIEIFRHIYEFDRGGSIINFDYSILYEINGDDTSISYKEDNLKINDRVRRTIGQTPLPDNVLIYYSGHNTIISSLLKSYQETFSRRIQTASLDESRRFIGVGSEYKELLLAVLLMQPEGNKAREFICSKLGIINVSNEVKIVLDRPFYAVGEDYNIDIHVPESSYWKPRGITKDFLDKLSECISPHRSGPMREEGYLSRDDRYVQYFDISKIKEKFIENSSLDLFQQLDNLKMIGMLSEITITITLENEFETDITNFSDGQFQSVYIYTVTELFKDRNCITLLDEPDSFLHPEWQFDFLKQVFEITEAAANTNHVLMSSHSAATLINHNSHQICIFSLENNQTQSRMVNKNYAINQLSSDMIKYSEDEQILSILRTINIERKPIFFTEGSTDPDILKTAWHKLYAEPMPFIPIYAFNCVYLRPLLQDERILNELHRQPVFGLFDFDEAYNEWNYLKVKWGEIETDPYKGISTGDEIKKRYAFLLPVPSIPDVEKLVIQDRATKTHFAHKSKMGIEHLFYGDPQTHEYFEKELIPGGAEIIVFKERRKTTFAKEIIPMIEPTHFEVFRPMFEFIKSKCE